ncbi:MAG: aminotransferase class V-fold PLP-dependent enzyme [Deltaproteobacteria bacterium]|nr:aminotransferase class V-fold PLP-dependent enzyme [Deltaproteobacteria bacterium]NNK06436.1 aminotransferase class V-fold PLP-dependent enzyme [Myxococcales bacterium]MBT8463153.1 aminotransferase class V-fold PLP-dependent enzyme [Deltaproteobacteria bacterium]MBT8480194.1 aminotransferase class V-fold PLP-dependent enzyme [Deltaproteobacteria bacterium]NNK42674.1 aminotransferase class V-fold PLP-dependent enzyme [Myxococcales bacterium]
MVKPQLGDRALFPKLEGVAYLAHAAISPLSAPVCERIRDVTEDYACGGMAGFVRWAPRLAQVRRDLASLVSASPGEITIVANTTQGVIDIAFGLPWRKGDRVVLFDGEFPANVTPWQQAAEEFALELRWLSLDGFHRSVDEGLVALERELERGVRLVAVSAVQYKTGLRMPLAEMAALCHRYGAELFVDAIQALGATPVDVSWGIDYLSSGSHKHLMGAEGTGFLYVAERCAAAMKPRLAGWLGHEDPVAFLVGDEPQLRYDNPLKRGAPALETGTSNVIGLAALGASLELIGELGVPAIHQHVDAYLEALEAGLAARGFRSHRAAAPALRSTILGLTVPADVRLSKLAAALRDRGVIVNTPDGLLRLAPHWPNASDEVPRVLDAVDQSLAELRR